MYSPRERAALAWTEAITLVATNDLSDELYAQVSAEFNEQEIVDLTLAIITINGWNRLNAAFRTEVGGYQPAATH